MNDADFDTLIQYINLRITQFGGTFISVLQSEWTTLNDQDAMKTALGDASLENLTARRTTLDADRAALDAEITRLEGRSGGGR